MTKKILHLTVGDDNWTPTKKQLQEIADLFAKADQDPVGNAIVATPTGVVPKVIEYDEINLNQFNDTILSDDYMFEVESRGSKILLNKQQQIKLYEVLKNTVDGMPTKVTTTSKTTFYSTKDQRVDNNPTGIDDYDGPDDVSLRYAVLSDEDKAAMGKIKLAAQYLINALREHCGESAETTLAIRNAQLASMWELKNLQCQNK